jgi:hypothetical protein
LNTGGVSLSSGFTRGNSEVIMRWIDSEIDRKINSEIFGAVENTRD